MPDTAKQWLDKTLQAILDRDGADTGESTVIANHMAQMRSFGIRQGIELYPLQDSNRVRYKFIEKLYEDNRIDLHLAHYWDLFLAGGQILWYLRPTGKGYRIYHFGKDNFRASYSPSGDLEEVVIIYSYNVRPDMNISGLSVDGAKRWIRLILNERQVVTEYHEQRPQFYDSHNQIMAQSFDRAFAAGMGGSAVRSESAINTLGWIPAVITGNYIAATGTEGRGEFEQVARQLYQHDQMCRSVAENINFFGNPTLVTSRTVAEVTESGNQPTRETYSSASGFVGSTPSTRNRDPDERSLAYNKVKVAKVIGNVQPDERFGYIVPDPVSPDQSRYVAEYRESLHATLGGIDPQSISAGATAFEIKSLYGRSAATALTKARSLYKYGLCKVFEMAIAAEEQVFKASIAMAMNIPLDSLTDQAVQDLLAQPTLPKELKVWSPQGLAPLGDRRVQWRWLGPVFENSPLDMQQYSIVVRNLEELGVETSASLKFMFPEKTETEIKSMMTGFPFREANQSAMALSQQIASLTALMTTPDPRTGQPIGITVNNVPIIESVLHHILKRLQYGLERNDADTPGSWSSTPGGSELSGPGVGIPPGDPSILSSTGGAVLPAGTYGATSSAVAAGIQSPGFLPLPNDGPTGATPFGGQQPDFASALPVPGGTTRPQPGLPSTASGLYAQRNVVPVPGIPIDLWDKPGLLQSLFPSTAVPEPVNPSRSRASRVAKVRGGSGNAR
ncbi:MAG: hypothetical protein ACRCT2_01740 [Plesiomonas shigelloides]